jgi:hypothetical protein
MNNTAATTRKPPNAAFSWRGAVLAFGGVIAALPGALDLLMQTAFRGRAGGVPDLTLPFAILSPVLCLAAFVVAMGCLVSYIRWHRPFIGLAVLTWFSATACSACSVYFFVSFLSGWGSLEGR